MMGEIQATRWISVRLKITNHFHINGITDHDQLAQTITRHIKNGVEDKGAAIVHSKKSKRLVDR
jgi:hypothetical protein